MIVELKPTIGADQRTRNRIRENGPTFTTSGVWKQNVMFPVGNVTGPWGFFKSHSTNWEGWLPIEQLEVRSV